MASSPTATVAVIGNPNSGKSTLFNRLTGLRQTTGNYPGVTVEKHSGIAQLEKSAVELVIYNTLGQIVREMFNSTQYPGNYKVTWDGRDDYGKDVPSGIYILRFQADDFNKAIKIIKTK